MKIVKLKNLKTQKIPTVVTVGIFDGVHIGHKKIFTELIKHAKKDKATSVVLTFDPHPEKVLKGKKSIAMLSSLKHRLTLLNASGIDLCVLVRFNKKFAEKDTMSFIKNILIKKLNMKKLIVGESFSFGSDNTHTPSSLKDAAKKVGFKLKFVNPKKDNKHVISSSIIRSLIEKGRLQKASRLLGRPASVLGVVVHGRKRGRIVGFKTANIDPHHEAIPPSGVYASYSVIDRKVYKSVVNIGRRPTFKEKDPTIESHIFGLDRNLYGKDIEVYFAKRLRSEKRFKNEQDLCEQIIKDASLAKDIL